MSREDQQRARQKVVQYLQEAHATEAGLVNVLVSQIAVTPSGSYRDALESHLRETRDHARRIQQRLRELSGSRGPVQFLVGLTETAIAQGLALGKLPLDLLRGSGGEEKVLKNAKDASATEALEIATYVALERLANACGDRVTAELAASIREDEERMLARILREIPGLTAAVVGADIDGEGSYDVTETGAADAVRAAVRTGGDAVERARTEVRHAATQARRVPGVAHAEGQVKGTFADESDLPIAGYDSLSATDIVARLPKLSQVDLAKVEAYERRHDNRTTVLHRIDSLRGDEPWLGYDEQTVQEIAAELDGGDEDRVQQVKAYERSHKNRSGVLAAADREMSGVH